MTVKIRIVCGSPPPSEHEGQPTAFGLQDSKEEVHPGTKSGKFIEWVCELTVKDPKPATPVFRGPFVHGPSSTQFLYLSWKRMLGASPPWIERIKIPLTGINPKMLRYAAKPDMMLETDVTGRRPHAREPILWKPVHAR